MSDRTWELYVIEYARAHQQPVDSLVLGAHDDGAVDLPFTFVLARNGNRNVLIDSGHMNDGMAAVMNERFGIPHWISPLRMLAELGVQPADVSDILISHAHYDHMGTIAHFPNATVHIQKREWLSWMEAMAMPKQFGFLTLAINPDDLRAGFDAAVEHRLHLLDGDADDVVPGLHARDGKGHTLGSQFFAVETARGRLVVSGDCVYSLKNLRGHADDGVYAPLAFGVGAIWDQLIAMDRIQKEIAGDTGRLIILHDFRRWQGLPVVKQVDGFVIVKAA
ncbi:MAG: N-acyl homoserine lactonase family protein [Alphaproteobacteria bacterium]